MKEKVGELKVNRKSVWEEVGSLGMRVGDMERKKGNGNGG